MHSLSAPTGKPLHPDESKYVKIFQNVDLSSNFYFRSEIITCYNKENNYYHLLVILMTSLILFSHR